eukprot:scaffold189240_cov19-Tisochrysis_lutea.AAC.1
MHPLLHAHTSACTCRDAYQAPPSDSIKVSVNSEARTVSGIWRRQAVVHGLHVLPSFRHSRRCFATDHLLVLSSGKCSNSHMRWVARVWQALRCCSSKRLRLSFLMKASLLKSRSSSTEPGTCTLTW